MRNSPSASARSVSPSWLLGTDDGVFRFGDAPFEGSGVGAGLTAPVVGVAPTPDNDAY